MGANAYTVSKGDVLSILKAAAPQFGRSGIRVNTLFTFVINTPMKNGLVSSKSVLDQLLANDTSNAIR